MRLQNRLTLSFALFAVGISGLLVLMIFYSFRDYQRENSRDRLLDLVKVAALQVDADALLKLNTPAQESGSDYANIKRTLLNIRNASENIGYVYTMRKNEQAQVMFLVDAEEDPALVSHLGDIYQQDNSLIFQSVFMPSATPAVENEFATDQWGTWLSAYAPIYTKGGLPAGILGIDISMAVILEREWAFLKASILFFLISIPISFIAGSIFSAWLTTPLLELTSIARQIANGELPYSTTIEINSINEISGLAQSFNLMARRLASTISGLEERVAERTGELTKRSKDLEASAAVGQIINSTPDSESLINQVVVKIGEHFNLYYVGLFLLDDQQEWAVLQSGTGAAGRAMLDHGHRIKVDDGMIGWCIAHAQARVTAEVGVDAIRLATAELPDTRSEAAIPLRTRGQVIGALTVQSVETHTFDETLMVILQTLANQIAVALDNSRLFAQSQEAIEALRHSYSELSRKAWADTLRTRRVPGYLCNRQGVRPINSSLVGPQTDESMPFLRLPVTLRGQVLGTIEARKPGGALAWSEEEKAVLQSLVDQLSVALESARLYQETQRRAERERVASEITSKLRASNNPQVILQTAVQELRQALQAQEANILVQVSKSDREPTVERRSPPLENHEP